MFILALWEKNVRFVIIGLMTNPSATPTVIATVPTKTQDTLALKVEQRGEDLYFATAKQKGLGKDGSKFKFPATEASTQALETVLLEHDPANQGALLEALSSAKNGLDTTGQNRFNFILNLAFRQLVNSTPRHTAPMPDRLIVIPLYQTVAAELGAHSSTTKGTLISDSKEAALAWVDVPAAHIARNLDLLNGRGAVAFTEDAALISEGFPGTTQRNLVKKVDYPVGTDITSLIGNLNHYGSPVIDKAVGVISGYKNPALKKDMDLVKSRRWER